MKSGLIGISNNKVGIFPALIRFFTDSNYTHSFVTFVTLLGEASIIEATTVVQIVPFDKHYELDADEAYVLFEPKADKEAIDKALDFIFLNFSGRGYGYTQVLWFVYRWAMLKVFNKIVTKYKNPLTSGIICSELVYHYLCQLGTEFTKLLKDFNSDTINAEDILKIMVSNPNLFTQYKIKG